MKPTLVRRISHRDFLKGCGLAVLGAGAAQVAVPARPALAADGSFDNLYVTGVAGIGTTSPGAKLHVEVDQAPTEVWVRTFRTADSSSWIRLDRARNTRASPAVVASGDVLGSIVGRGYSGAAAFKNAAGISFSVDGEPDTGGSATDMPGRIRFSTSPDGTATLTTRMTIRADGKVGIGTDSPTVALQVVGDIRASGVLNINGSVAIDANGVATQAFYAS